MNCFNLEQNLITTYVIHLNSLFHLSIAFIMVVSLFLIWDPEFEDRFLPWNLSGLFEPQKYYFSLNPKFIVYFFENGHINNAVLTLRNVVKRDVENEHFVSLLSNVIHITVVDKSVYSNLDGHDLLLCFNKVFSIQTLSC